MIHGRSLARVYAVQFLYHLQYREFNELKVKLSDPYLRHELLPKCLQEFESSMEGEELPKGSALEYAKQLIIGIFEHYQELEDILGQFSKKWTLDKMTPIDRTILMQSVYELVYAKHIPPSVVMDEAIEMAKAYSSQQASGFINGVLDSVAKHYNDSQSQS